MPLAHSTQFDAFAAKHRLEEVLKHAVTAALLAARCDAAMRAAAITEALRFYTQTNGDPSQSEFASTIDSFTVEIEAGLTEF